MENTEIWLADTEQSDIDACITLDFAMRLVSIVTGFPDGSGVQQEKTNAIIK